MNVDTELGLGKMPRVALSALSAYAGFYYPRIWAVRDFGRYLVAALLLILVAGGVGGLSWWLRRRGIDRGLAADLAFGEIGRAVINGGIWAIVLALWR